MGIPRVYRKSGERPIISFTFADIINGTGIIKLFGATTKLTTTLDYILTPNQIYSNDVEITDPIVDGSAVRQIELTFNLSVFNLPRRLKGTAIFNIPFGVKGDGDNAGTTGTGYVVLKLFHYDGSTAIQIGSTLQSESITKAGSGVNAKVFCMPLIIPLTHFKKGDNLRLVVEGWGNTNGVGALSISIGHDPQNRDGTILKPSTDSDLTTKMEMYVPSLIDV